MHEHTQSHELKHDQQAADPPVAVRERVERFELVVRKRRLHDGRHVARRIVCPLHALFESGLKAITERRRHESGFLDRRVPGPDEVLTVPQPACIRVLTRCSLHEDSLQVRDQAHRERPFLDPAECLLRRDDEVENLPDLERELPALLEIRLEKRLDRRKRPLQRARTLSLPAKRRSPEESGVWNLACCLVEASERSFSADDGLPRRSRELDRRRKRIGEIGVIVVMSSGSPVRARDRNESSNGRRAESLDVHNPTICAKSWITFLFPNSSWGGKDLLQLRSAAIGQPKRAPKP